mmetsp:Transcript_17358/g.26215  ORF Transcript_17358/g.26215 Transcript_17358/m.26215 type:complete len:912 (-) Transcript_17358:287-3022(-)
MAPSTSFGLEVPAKFARRIDSGFDTVKEWENEELLKECRAQIPFHILCPEQYHGRTDMDMDDGGMDMCTSIEQSPYINPEDDHKYQGDDLFLKRLAKYFQEIMTWVNNPPCELCNSDQTKCRQTRGPLTSEEFDGKASRVEIYWCPNCNAETTTFPRYNSPRKLLETKKGRCGEYANLFGLYCRAAGFETRYILDYTDHVWTEVYSKRLGRWIMADSCEGQIDATSMYEKGWGKKLNWILAFTLDSVVDITRRYTRAYLSEEFQARRRDICPRLDHAVMYLNQKNDTIRSINGLSAKRIEEIQGRMGLEEAFFEETMNMASWAEGEYSEGRQSGSLEWRVLRGEAGIRMERKNQGNSGGKGDIATICTEVVIGSKIDHSKLKLRCEDGVVPSTIAMRLPDEYMSFAAQKAATFSAKKKAFLEFIKSNKGEDDLDASSQYIGYCTKDNSPVYLMKRGSYPFQKCDGNVQWKTYHFVPQSLESTLGIDSSSHEYMFDIPVNSEYFINLLGDHLIANGDGSNKVSISTTEALKNSRLVAFYFSAHWCGPCRQFSEGNRIQENTGAIVDQPGMVLRDDPISEIAAPKVVVQSSQNKDQKVAQNNLNAMLSEMYETLKDENPSHGLEVVFVSSDRDSASFENYFQTMPWLALPFTDRAKKNVLSQQFGVNGIPCLIVLDAISGAIVVGKEDTRFEVGTACQHGNDSIKKMFSMWSDRIPEESKEIVKTLKMACVREEDDEEEKNEASEAMHIEPTPQTQLELGARVNIIYTQLLAEGIQPNEAGAQAIKQVTEEIKAASFASPMEIDESAQADTEDMREEEVVPGMKVDLSLVGENLIGLALKSIENVEKTPYSFKFRSFKLGNKTIDVITRARNGLDLLRFLGFEIYSSDVDFIASIPLCANLLQMKAKAENLLG